MNHFHFTKLSFFFPDATSAINLFSVATLFVAVFCSAVFPAPTWASDTQDTSVNTSEQADTTAVKSTEVASHRQGEKTANASTESLPNDQVDSVDTAGKTVGQELDSIFHDVLKRGIGPKNGIRLSKIIDQDHHQFFTAVARLSPGEFSNPRDLETFSIWVSAGISGSELGYKDFFALVDSLERISHFPEIYSRTLDDVMGYYQTREKQEEIFEWIQANTNREVTLRGVDQFATLLAWSDSKLATEYSERLAPGSTRQMFLESMVNQMSIRNPANAFRYLESQQLNDDIYPAIYVAITNAAVKLRESADREMLIEWANRLPDKSKRDSAMEFINEYVTVAR